MFNQVKTKSDLNAIYYDCPSGIGTGVGSGHGGNGGHGVKGGKGGKRAKGQGEPMGVRGERERERERETVLISFLLENTLWAFFFFFSFSSFVRWP